MVKEVKESVNQKLEIMGAKGFNITNIVIPKPDIPEHIADNYKAVKVEWTNQLKQKQKLETDKIKKEIEHNNAVSDAEREKAVQEVEIEKRTLEKEGEKNVSAIQNQIIEERAQANSKANKALYENKDYVKMEMAKALSTHTKFYFSGNSPLGGLLTKIFDESKPND